MIDKNKHLKWLPIEHLDAVALRILRAFSYKSCGKLSHQENLDKVDMTETIDKTRNT